MNKNVILASVISATAGGILGGVITYLTVKKTLEGRADAEIEDVKKVYAEREARVEAEEGRRTIAFNTPTEKIEAAKRLMENLGYSSDEETEVDEVEVETIYNIFDHPVELDEDGVPIEEEYVREEGKPFLISNEEFFNDGENNDKITLTYYEGDDTLCDERDQPIDNVDYVIGERHLHMFGHRSDDENTVYIRNELLTTDFEVIHEEGEFAVRVLGLDAEALGLKVPKSRPKRMRDDD